ncbi:MAG TPA: DNRLRE domain-containing protein, partial [Bacteroidia bacterium]|nr:DNRLRE domain-containing protein [Bacteroidia bacterium]
MKKYYLLLAVFFLAHLALHAQITITLQPDSAGGKDARIDSYSPNANNATSSEFLAGMWTINGNWFTVRTLVQFDLSGVPANSVINSANLSLYYNPNNSNFNHIQYGPNASYLQRITGSWQENTVTWNNQPVTTTQNQASIPASTGSTQDFTNLDVTALVTDMKNNPSTSFGFLLRMQSETQSYRGLIFASSDYSDPVKRPKLVINYTICTLPSATITAGGSTTFCSGGSVTLNAAPTGAAYAYQWIKDGINISGATANSYVATAGGSYTCLVRIIATGCSKVSNAISVTVNTIPAPTISAGGATAFCTGSSVLLTALPATGVTYQWKQNGSNIGGATSQTYSATASGNFSCLVTNSCGSGTSNTVFVTVYTSAPAANITAGGPTTFCSNSNVQLLSSNSGAGITYQWQKNSVNISGATTVSYSANLAGSYRCIVTNPCGSSTSNAISVTVNTQPSAVITPGGTANICTGGSQLLNASAGTGYVYQWKKNGTNISGATAQTYTASQAGSYTVAVTLGSCTATSAATTVTISQALTPTITYAGFGGWCGSTSVRLETNNSSGYIYTWFEDTHPVPNSNSFQLEVGHNANYSVQINNGCGMFSAAPYTVTDFNNPWLQPYITITNSGSLNLCGGGSVTLSINSNNFYQSPSFQWYRDGVAIGGATGQSYNATTGGNYVCSVIDFLWCGFQGPLVFSNWLVATSAPSALITPQGSTTICNGSSVILAANTGGGYAYQWKNNGTNISGATNQNYSATANGSYTVAITNTCGTAASSAVVVTVTQLPSATITPAGPTTFCANESVVLNAPTGANRTYQWLKGGNYISGATQSFYTATISGTYKVIVTNSVTGCSKTTSTGTVLTVNAQPNATITPQGPTTFCAGGSVVLQANTGGGLTYKWKKGSNYISGATLSNYTATIGGNYRVQVTNSNGCSKTSALVAVSVPCKEDGTLIPVNNFDVSVYPNPSSGDFVFEISNAANEKISISVYDMIGKLVLSENILNSQFTIRSTKLTAGIYSAEIICGENKKV